MFPQYVNFVGNRNIIGKIFYLNNMLQSTLLRIHKGYALLLIIQILVYSNMFLLQNTKLSQQLKIINIKLELDSTCSQS